MKYKLTIHKSINNTNLKLVEAFIVTDEGPVAEPYKGTPVSATEYRVEMPPDVDLVKFRIVAEDPDATVQIVNDDDTLGTAASGVNGLETDYDRIKDASMIVKKVRVISRTGAHHTDYVITAVNIPEGTKLDSVQLSGENDVDTSGNRIYKQASISGLTSYFGSIPNKDAEHPATKVWLKLTAENKLATVKAPGLNKQSAMHVLEDEFALSDGIITEINVSVESPSGIVQSYKVYVAKYTHDYELIIWSNDELTERVGASAYERKTPLPFNVTKSNLRIGMADPSKGYQLSINGGPKQPITTATPQILTSVSLPAINNVIPITVYDKEDRKGTL